MKKIKLLEKIVMLAVCLAGPAGWAQGVAQNPPGFPAADPAADPAALQLWQSNRFGMFIHYDPSCLTGQEISWSRAGERRDRNEDAKDGTPAAEYDALYHRFNPTNFNARTWVEIAQAAGMKYIVFTAKHHDGFAMFDSKLTDYKITESPFQRDMCAELAQACHAAGMSLGFYYSPPDWHHPDFFTTNQAQYIQYFQGQVRELLSNYGRVDELWFDTDGGVNTPETWDNKDLFPMIRKLQPQILVTTRCGGWGDFGTPEQRIGGFKNDAPWETCMTICQQWSWKPNDKMKSLPECIKTLVLCVGGDGNLLLDVGPMPDGEIEACQVTRLKEIGIWLGRNGESIYGTRGGPWKPTKNFASTRKGDEIYVHLLAGQPETIELPDVAARVESAALLGGEAVKFSQAAGQLTLTVPLAVRDASDTVVKLTLDSSAMDLPVMEIPSNFKATASNVYLGDKADFGAQQAFDDDAQTRWATDSGTKQAWIAVDYAKPKTVAGVQISEYANRVQQFEFQYRVGNDWKTLFSGTTLGQFFEKTFPPVTACEFRLNILAASDGPTINEIKLL